MIKDSFCGDKEVSYTGIMADTSIHTPDSPDTADVDLPQSLLSSFLPHFHEQCCTYPETTKVEAMFKEQ